MANKGFITQELKQKIIQFFYPHTPLTADLLRLAGSVPVTLARVPLAFPDVIGRYAAAVGMTSGVGSPALESRPGIGMGRHSAVRG